MKAEEKLKLIKDLIEGCQGRDAKQEGYKDSLIYAIYTIVEFKMD